MPRKDLADYEALRGRAAAARGRTYWRTLDELAGTPEFEEYLHREFPQAASEWREGASRRDFLKLMAASLALAGVAGCTTEQDSEKIVPYVEDPEGIVPGKPLYFATTLDTRGFGTGVLVESHMGRPTKVEGNPDHPASLGRTTPFLQAEVLSLYDPDRSQVVRNAGQISTYRLFRESLSARLAGQRAGGGAGLRILTETVTSPTLIAQIERLREQFPEMRWHHWDPVFDDAARDGSRLAFGDDAANLHAVYDFSQADAILALDADFLSPGAYPLPYSRQFIARRKLTAPDQPPEMNRLYVVETTPTTTGAKADHALRVRPHVMLALAYAVARRLGVEVEPPESLPDVSDRQAWVDAVADDLQNHRLREPGASLVIAGYQAPAAVQALAHAMNERLGNVGRTVAYREPVAPHADGSLESLRQLAKAIRDPERPEDAVEVLIILGGNPVFTAPADLDFAGAMEQVPYRAHLSLQEDETSWLCHWHVPQSHPLEIWGDLRAFDGTASLIQPLINPLYQGTMSSYELVSLMLGEDDAPAYDLVRDHWREQYQGNDFEDFWRRALHRGTIDESQGGQAPTTGPGRGVRTVSLAGSFAEALQESARSFATARGRGTFDLILRPDPSIWDGRYANNAWLQELPKPLTKLTWDNAALMSGATAEKLGVTDGSLIEIQQGRGPTVRAAVLQVPGHPDDAVTLYFGYGRTRVGRVGAGTGFNAYPLRTSDNPWYVPNVALRPLGETYPLATTQKHFLLDTTLRDRNIMLSGTAREYAEHPEHPPFMHGAVEHAADHEEAAERTDGAAEHEPGGEEHKRPSLYDEWPYQEGNQWAMVMDQTACIGCNACVVACQSENNIPVVGKAEVLRSREMHWLRIDTYYTGAGETFEELARDPETHFQPMACVHCEKAPCEVVCPVAATSHSPEGLNEMTYNRCVGTRYCSNNCPYKVRRFNFFEYTKPAREHPVLQLLQNPDVTVRSRGVMEKCTYCVQRLSQYRIESEKERLAAEIEGRPPRDIPVETACAAACPTDAIIFGNKNRPDSEVRRLRDDHPLNYGVLADLNTQPRTTYLASMKNPNPDLAPAQQPHERHA